MSHDTSRKHFFAKLAGLAASLAVGPKILAKSASVPPVAPVNVRPEPRAVARRADSL